MLTIKEIATQAGKSKTAVYNLVKKHNIPTFKKDGSSYIDDDGIALILAHFSIEQGETIKDILENEVIQEDFQVENVVENSHLIRLLESQLHEKDKTIQGLIQSNNALIQVVANQQTLNLVDKQAVVIPPKKSLFERIFKR